MLEEAHYNIERGIGRPHSPFKSKALKQLTDFSIRPRLSKEFLKKALSAIAGVEICNKYDGGKDSLTPGCVKNSFEEIIELIKNHYKDHYSEFISTSNLNS